MAGCAQCGNPLVLQVDGDEDDMRDTSAPDDLEMPCGCHFHWQCLMDEAAEVAVTLKCPSCQSRLAQNEAGPSVTNPVYHTTSGVNIVTRYHSEGGVQDNYDVLPSLTEEAYLLSNPGTRRARAFLDICREGDLETAVDLLTSDPDDDAEEEELDLHATLRYQDPLDYNKSGLHLAIENDNDAVFYLLLFLASGLPTDAFPPNLLQLADQAGIHRPEVQTGTDIRQLQDARGETAEAYAIKAGGKWAGFVQSGIFS